MMHSLWNLWEQLGAQSTPSSLSASTTFPSVPIDSIFHIARACETYIIHKKQFSHNFYDDMYLPSESRQMEQTTSSRSMSSSCESAAFKDLVDFVSTDASK